MAAREKLNVAYLLGSLGLAILAGALTGSWLAGFITLAMLVGASFHLGGIRTGGRR